MINDMGNNRSSTNYHDTSTKKGLSSISLMKNDVG